MTGLTDLIGPDNIYPGDERVGATLKRAYEDAAGWIENNWHAAGTDPQPSRQRHLGCPVMPRP